MYKFKKGDKVKVIAKNSKYFGKVGIVDEDNSIVPRVLSDGIEFFPHELQLQLYKKESLKDMEVGDVLVDVDGKKAEVLEVLTQSFLKSCWNDLRTVARWCTFDEAELNGWKLDLPEAVADNTIEVDGKTYAKDALIERLKDLPAIK